MKNKMFCVALKKCRKYMTKLITKKYCISYLFLLIAALNDLNNDCLTLCKPICMLAVTIRAIIAIIELRDFFKRKIERNSLLFFQIIEITRFFCQIAIQNSSYRGSIVHIGWSGLVAQYKDLSDAVGTLFGNLFYSEVVFFTDILQNNSFF